MCACVCAGMNFWARESDNIALEVKFYKGEMTEEEYVGCTWPEDRLAHMVTRG